MIPVKCVSYLDDYRNCGWPQELPALPRIGDFIQPTNKSLDPLKVSKVIFQLNVKSEVIVELVLLRSN